jgi:hypothetical protein
MSALGTWHMAHGTLHFAALPQALAGLDPADVADLG